MLSNGRLKILLYRQVVLPALTYACPICVRESHINCRLYARMVTIQRVALSAITGAYRTRSTAALQVLLQAAPIDLELERLNAEFRLLALRRHVAFGSLRFRPGCVALPHKDIVAHPSLTTIPSFRRLSRTQAFVALRAGAVYVFADGSYTSHAAGVAYVAFDGKYTVIHVGRFRLRRYLSLCRRGLSFHGSAQTCLGGALCLLRCAIR
ncbi:hypothetical protein MTO96_041943 [Rhipicephalus appendiculatus]